jgi:hypothetical protein
VSSSCGLLQRGFLTGILSAGATFESKPATPLSKTFTKIHEASEWLVHVSQFAVISPVTILAAKSGRSRSSRGRR